MDIKILSPEEIDFKEKDVQSAFEKDLSKLEEGLVYIDSEIIIGNGRIDTLAFDSNNNCPVFIEYKRRGEFSKDALIQLMDYISWFMRDRNRIPVLEKIIRKKVNDVEEFDPEIRLICVVHDIDDRIKNALYAIAYNVKIYSYVIAKDTANNIILVPKLEIDNDDIEKPIPSAYTENDLYKNHEHLKELTKSVINELTKDNETTYYIRKKSIRFKKNKVLAKVGMRKDYIFFELKVGRGNINDSDFKYWRQGESDWGYVHIYPSKGLTDKHINWIEKAKQFELEESVDQEE